MAVHYIWESKLYIQYNAKLAEVVQYLASMGANFKVHVTCRDGTRYFLKDKQMAYVVTDAVNLLDHIRDMGWFVNHRYQVTPPELELLVEK